MFEADLNVYQLFSGLPIYAVIVPKLHHTFIVDRAWADENLTPVTCLWADSYYDSATDSAWYRFDYGKQAAMLAWDFAPFLHQIIWGVGLSIADDIFTRREKCADVLMAQRMGFWMQFKLQFVVASLDDGYHTTANCDPQLDLDWLNIADY